MRSIIIVGVIHSPGGGRTVKKIKYCCHNFKKGTKSVFSSIKEQYPDQKQKKKECLGRCKLCSKQCFVMVGKNDMICAMSADELYGKLKELLQTS